MFCICILFVFVILYLCREWSTSSSGSSVGFRLSSQVGFVYSAPLTFLPGQTRKLHTIARSALSLCAFVYFVFAYEFRPSHVKILELLLLLRYNNSQQIAHHCCFIYIFHVRHYSVQYMYIAQAVHKKFCSVKEVCFVDCYESRWPCLGAPLSS